MEKDALSSHDTDLSWSFVSTLRSLISYATPSIFKRDTKATTVMVEPTLKFWVGGFEAYYGRETFADVELVVAETKKVLKVHRIVLARSILDFVCKYYLIPFALPLLLA